jgi:membrane protein YdbS with pleckstrin-like domain
MVGGLELETRHVRGWARALNGLMVVSFLAICLSPHFGRLHDPSLFSDDVTRVEHLQTMPLGKLLFRPFNEHVAPVFELVSWVTWQVAGRRLSHAPAAFTVAALVPFLLCLLALASLVRRESGSATVALAAVAVFSLSAVHIEAVWWYSASSFTWALLGTVIAWLCVLRSLGPEIQVHPAGDMGWLAAAALAALVAPACSAIGLLAGPVAALRAVQDSRGRGWWRAVAVGLVPLTGTVLYLVLASQVRYHAILTQSVDRNLDIGTGLLCTLRAPIDVLASGLIGMENADQSLGGGLDLVLGVLLMMSILTWGLRSPLRPLLLGGLALILGGYGLTYSVRNFFGPHWLMEVQRYHLFPQHGFVLVLVSVSRPLLARFDARPRSALLAAMVVASLLLVAHRPMMRLRARAYRFPDQARTLKALERLETLCREHRITRDQALAALDPIRTRWFPHDSNALRILAAAVPGSGLADNRVRPTLLAALSLSEREALCGGMAASPYLRPASESSKAEASAVGRLVGAVGDCQIGPGDRFLARGPAHLEFQMSDSTHQDSIADARMLCVPGFDPEGKLEVWWTGDGAMWSETRSVRWQPASEGPTGQWAIALGSLPHWSASRASRIRVVVRSVGTVALEAPRLLR